MNKGLIFALDLIEKKEVTYNNDFKNNQWLHFDYKHPDTKLWLLEESGLPKEICYAFLDTHSSNRLIVKDNGFFFIFRSLNLNEGEEKEDMVSIHMWIENQRIITMRSQKVKGIDELKNKITGSKKTFNTKKLFLNILEHLTNTTGNYVFELYDTIDEIDEILIENFSKNLRYRISNLRKKIIELRRFLLPQKTLLETFYKEDLFGNGEHYHLKNILEQNTKIVEDLNALRDRANVCQEEFNGKISDEMTKTIYRLTILSTIFLPLNFIGSLLGINVAGIPFADNPNAFFIVCSIVLIIAVLEFLWFRKKRYF